MKKRYLFLFMLIMSVSFVRYEALAIDSISDADGNTKVQTEKFANEDKIRFDTGGTERMIIDNAGNVGIGVPVPGTRLDVKGAVRVGNDTNSIAIVQEGTSNWVIGDNPWGWGAGKFFIGVNEDTPPELTIQNDGNVGIGTTSPKVSLHNNGDFITKGPWSDVRAYGAVGDRITDDAAAIQAAINATPDGGTVYFPKGWYKITTPLTISGTGRSLSLVGVGVGSVINYTGSGDYGIKWVGIQRPQMADLVYIGNGAATGGIYFELCLGGLIQDVLIYGTGGVAWDIYGSMKMTFINCHVDINQSNFNQGTDWGGNPTIHWRNRLWGTPPNQMEPNLNTWISCTAAPTAVTGIGWEFSSGARCYLINNQTQGLSTGMKFDYTGASPPAYISVLNQWMEGNTTDYDDPGGGMYGIGMELGRVRLADKNGTLYREGNSTTTNPLFSFLENNPTAGAGLAVLGQSNYGTAICGKAIDISAFGVGVKGEVIDYGKAIYGKCNGPWGYAGYFDGNVEATGTVTAAAVSTSGNISAGGTLSAGSALAIGGGASITKHLSGTATWDPPSINNGSATSTTVTVTGADIGDTVAVGFSVAVPGRALLVGAVTAANTVTVTLANHTGGALNLVSGTLRADVWKH